MGDLEFERIFQEFRGYVYPGILKLRSSDVWFRNEKTGRVDHYQSTDIENAEWISRARGYCLKIVLNNGQVHRYDGFGDNDYEKLKSFIRSSYESDLAKKELSYKGWNWGKLKIAGGTLDFIVDKNTAFEIPLNNVSQVNSGKNEVTLEFHQNDDAETCLMEIRFHLPPPKDSTEESMADEIYRRVVAKADIIQVTGDEIVEFKEMQCLQPRGRYDLKLYPTFIHFHGKTFDYKVPISTVYRMFLLPHRDNRSIFFVLNVDPPIKHGQTRYHFVILQFDKNSELTVELKLSEEELLKKYEGKLTKEMSGPEFEVIARLFKVLVGRKITVPGSFTSQSGAHTIGCSYKASVGFLYPLERGFMFVPRPAVHVRFDEITFVQFSRGTGAQRSFDFEVVTKQSSFTFTSIERDEYTRLFDFVVSKKLRVENIDDPNQSARGKYEEFSSDEGDHDAYLEKVKREGKKSGVMTINDFDDEDDEEDEDFLPPDSGSDVAEEYDSNPETTDSDYEDEGSGGVSEGSATSKSSTSDEDEEELKEGEEEGEEARKRREKKEKKKRRKEKERAWRERKEKKKKEKAQRKRGSEKSEKPATTRKRKTKDKNAPKRPITAFLSFLNETREQLKADNPGMDHKDISRLAGEKWKEMTSEQKEKYHKQFEEAKVAYKAAMEEYHRKLESGEIVPDNSAPPPTKKAKRSPAKKVGKTAASNEGSSANFKSAEFIASSGENSSLSSSSSDEEEEKKKKKKKVEVKKEGKEEVKEEEDDSGSSSEEEEEEEEEESGDDSDSD